MLSAEQIAKAVASLQHHAATKKLFRAVAQGQCIVVYGSATSGKERLARENVVLLQEYDKRVYNFDDKNDLKRFLQEAASGLLFAEAHFSGTRQLNLPLTNVIEIFFI